MASSKKSLASRAGSAVRRAVGGRSSAEEPAGSAAATSASKKAKKAPAKKAPAKKAPAKSAPAAKKAPAEKAPGKKAPAKSAPAAKKAPAKKAPAAKKAGARRGRGPAALVVRENESSWTAAELGEVRRHLKADVTRLSAELEHAETDLHDLMIDSGDGSGHDQADVGSSSFERDHEISIVNNARDMLTQSRHALERIQDGSYGVCEMNGEPIGKLRLMAFPRATLCMTCKQREERR